MDLQTTSDPKSDFVRISDRDPKKDSVGSRMVLENKTALAENCKVEHVVLGKYPHRTQLLYKAFWDPIENMGKYAKISDLGSSRVMLLNDR